jgi:uncharacterized protein (DUF2147 family)
MNRLFYCFILGAITLFFTSFTTREGNGDAVLGVWLTGSGKGKIKIYKDKNQRYHGKIVWLKEPRYEDGTPKVDKNNPDEARRKDPLLGLQNLRNFSFEGGNKWVDGQIYDPENGNDYNCKMELVDENTLEVRGFIGISLFGRTDTWKRQVLKK